MEKKKGISMSFFMLIIVILFLVAAFFFMRRQDSPEIAKLLSRSGTVEKFYSDTNQNGYEICRFTLEHSDELYETSNYYLTNNETNSCVAGDSIMIKFSDTNGNGSYDRNLENITVFVNSKYSDYD